MKTSIHLIVGVVLLSVCVHSACKPQSDTHTVQGEIKDIPISILGADTILEENDPATLNLNRHQLFIDTTRNSDRYQQILKWQPHEMDNEAVNFYISEITKTHTVTKVDLQEFPRNWISLKRMNGVFVLYDPCDGNTPSYSFTDSTIVYYGQLEAEADLYSQLISLTDSSINLELNTIPQKSQTEKALLTVRPHTIGHVYEFRYVVEGYEKLEYVTPTTNVKMFDMVVNHCVQQKRMEYGGFDE